MTNAVSIAQGGSNNVTTRNRIINGAGLIDQRNSGSSVTPSTNSQYTIDRWYAELSQASKFSVQQNAGSITPPAGFTSYIGVTVGASANVTVGAGDDFFLTQAIEGFNTYDIGWGTSNAKAVTVSFWVYSSLTGTFGFSLEANGNNASYPILYTISSANTWQYVTITIPGTAIGTWNNGNGIGVKARFVLGCGSTLSGTSGVWSSSRALSPTGAVNLISTNSATFYITGVQLEAGTTATPFEYRQYGTELALCQRYYIKYSANDANGGYASFFGGSTASNTALVISPFFPVSLRAPNPTQTWGGNLRLGYSAGASATLSGISASNQQIGVTGGYGAYTCTSHALGAQAFVLPGGAGDTTAYWAFQSEL